MDKLNIAWTGKMNTPYVGNNDIKITQKAANAIGVCIKRNCPELVIAKHNKDGFTFFLCGKSQTAITEETSTNCKTQAKFTGAKRC